MQSMKCEIQGIPCVYNLHLHLEPMDTVLSLMAEAVVEAEVEVET